MSVRYFSPGPASLPASVLQQIKDELLDTFGIGVSVMEVSHRSKYYERLNEETLTLARKVFQVPDTHSLLFSVCGAQQHFSLLIQHLSLLNEEISYTDTGVWAHFACEEAHASSRKVDLIYDGRASNYTSLNAPEPKNWKVSQNTKFVHITVNNTVYGTEYAKIPTFGNIPLVLDMTSALGSRADIPWAETGLIYASAQKNFGIAGVSVVIMRNDLLEKSREITKKNFLGKALSYHAAFDAKSILNTPPVVPVFAMNKMLHWIAENGGTPKMEEWSLKKARLVYEQIDKGFYIGRAEKNSRSRHNFVFKLPTEQQDEHFIAEAAKQHLLEIKGYRTTGGIRVSMYNGVSLESANFLAEFMSEYRRKFS